MGQEFFDDSFASLLRSSPEVASELGIRHVGRHEISQSGFTDISAAGQASRTALVAQTLRELRARRPADMGSAEALNYRLYEQFLRWNEFGKLPGTESHAYSLCDSPADHLAGVQTEIITCLAQWHPLATAADTAAYKCRVDAIARQIDHLIENLAARAAAGNVMPACIVTRVQKELAAFLALPPRKNPLASRLAAAGRAADAVHVAAAIEGSVYPAYGRLQAYLNSYPQESRVGLCRMPGGEGYYRYLLKAHTTTDLSPAEIHEIGVAEAEKLRAELSAKLADAGFKGADFAERYRAFEGDERFKIRVTNDAAASDTVASMQRRIDAIIQSSEQRLLPFFGIKPRAKVVARAIPALQEDNAHSAYAPPAEDGSRPGVFRFNAAQLAAGTTLDLYTVVYHETIPGHHMQLAIAQELQADLPAFRRIVVHAGYIEGWAKYAEVLPWMQGINRDPHWDIARTGRELVSTANLIIDSGIHSFGWSREQAIERFIHYTACGSDFAGYLADRVIARLAQLCAYKIGMRSMMRARERMESALGPRFDLRAYHDTVLCHGSLPLPVLDALVDAAIEKVLQ